VANKDAFPYWYPPSWIPDDTEEELELKYDAPWITEYETKCKHKWKATELIFSTVYDCETCGIKKENEDKV